MRVRKMKRAVCDYCCADFVTRAEREGRYCSARCANRAKAGAHPLYNGGLSFDRESGRWKIMCRDGTQLWFYRGVMAAHIGRLLRPDELVHHKNEDPSDDRLENLEITTRRDHIEIHRASLRPAA